MGLVVFPTFFISLLYKLYRNKNNLREKKNSQFILGSNIKQQGLPGGASGKEPACQCRRFVVVVCLFLLCTFIYLFFIYLFFYCSGFCHTLK